MVFNFFRWAHRLRKSTSGMHDMQSCTKGEHCQLTLTLLRLPRIGSSIDSLLRLSRG